MLTSELISHLTDDIKRYGDLPIVKQTGRNCFRDIKQGLLLTDVRLKSKRITVYDVCQKILGVDDTQQEVVTTAVDEILPREIYYEHTQSENGNQSVLLLE